MLKRTNHRYWKHQDQITARKIIFRKLGITKLKIMKNDIFLKLILSYKSDHNSKDK